ncbi:MAG: protein phosphatase 2C domain-containing protein [Ferruginibacter sp.]
MGENYFGITDPGRQRTNNEDSFIAKTIFNGEFILACVIDGVGGYEGGEVAAQLTRDEVIGTLDKISGNVIDQMISAFDNANERIIREKKNSASNEKMACVVTLAIVDIEKNKFYFAHVGDTRLYLYRDGSLIKVTKDHSSVGFLEDSGRLSEEAAMSHPKRNEVNKVLGYEKEIALAKDFIDTGESPFLPGDIILLCSDGLTDMITAGKIVSLLSSGKDLRTKGQLLINAANEAGGRDNITVAMVYNDKSPVKHEVTKPRAARKESNTDANGQTKIVNIDNTPGNLVTKKDTGEKNNGWKVLSYCLVILIILWSVFKIFKKIAENKAVIPASIIKQRNKQEFNLLDSINASSNGIVKLAAGQALIISDTVLLKKDSLHIVGNGSSFTRDSAYGGPAFVLASNCKYILLDSLTIENFNVGVLVLNKGLHLKNVQFKNCKVPLQFQQQLLQDTLVSGRQAETVFYYTDSVRR